MVTRAMQHAQEPWDARWRSTHVKDVEGDRHSREAGGSSDSHGAFVTCLLPYCVR